jgi:predicted nuclease of restriction endonuclease-like (RecB) superfamily
MTPTLKNTTPIAPQANNPLLETIVSLIDNARHKLAVTINSELSVLYWHIGKQINESILKYEKGEYGKTVIKELSEELTNLYGQGFSKRNLHNFVKFNELVPDEQIVHTVCAQLTWSHIRTIIYLVDDLNRDFYTQMCIYERWSVRTLQERISSMLFERTAISKKPELTIAGDLELLKNEKKITPDLVFRDPYFLDMLGLHDTYSEKDLESAILYNLQNFITEMGTDFAFVARQKRITIDNDDFYIDLLFYHRGLRCLVVIDLKLDKFRAAYKGQMELYLRWLERNDRREGENAPVGLILCSEKSPEQINYLLLDNPGQIKVAEYMTQLPDKKLLQEKLQRAIEIARENHK